MTKYNIRSQNKDLSLPEKQAIIHPETRHMVSPSALDDQKAQKATENSHGVRQISMLFTAGRIKNTKVKNPERTLPEVIQNTV